MAVQIPQYRPQVQAEVVPFQRQDPEVAGAVGRDIAGFGEAVSQYGAKIQRHDELIDQSNLVANSATLEANTLEQWRKVKESADPNDPEFHNLGQKFFNEVVTPNIDALGNNLNTQEGRLRYQETAAKFAAHFRDVISTDQAELTGAAVAQNAITATNARSSTAFNDPSSFDHVVDMNASDRQMYTRQGMGPAKALEWERQSNAAAAQAAVRGSAHLNPDRAQTDLDSGKYDKYLTGDQKSELTDYITRQKDTAEAKRKSDEAEARRQQEDADKGAASDILHKGVIIGSDGRARVKPEAWKALDAIKDPSEWRATYDALKRYQKGGEDDGEGKIKTDPHVLMSMIARLPGGPDAAAHPLTDIEARQTIGRGLTIENYDFLHGQLAGKEPPNPMATRMLNETLADVKNKMRAGPSANGLLGDPAALDHYTAWQNQFLKEYETALASGKNPLDFLDRSSRDYLPSLKNPMAWSQPTAFPGSLVVPRGATGTAKPPAQRKSLDAIFKGQ